MSMVSVIHFFSIHIILYLQKQSEFVSLMNSGLLRQPKWGHLKELHAAIKLCLKPLISGVNFTMNLGEEQQVRTL